MDTSEELGSDEMGKSNQSHRRIKGSSEFDGTFSKRSWREDTTLIVEDKRIYVSSSILSLMSPVFTAMFEDENNEDMTFELNGKIYDDMIEFLQCIYPNVLKPITIENISTVLPLVVEYEVQSLKEKCQSFLKEFISDDTSALDICKIIRVISDCKFDDQSVHDVYVRHAIKKGIECILEADKEYPLPVDKKMIIQSGVIESLNNELSNSKMELKNLRHDYNMLKQIDFRRLWFGDVVIPDLEDARVGYLTYDIDIRDSATIYWSPSVTIHDISWYILVKKTNKKLGLFLNGSSAVGYFKKWSCEVYGKIVLRNKIIISDIKRELTHAISEIEPDWGYSKFTDIETLLDEKEGFLNEKKKVTVDIQFLVGKPKFD